ncbi:MAG: tyrosine-type recombinase/integrase, partial [Gammaproteobacteria bacterium]
MSTLADAVKQYLELRRGLGYKLEREGHLLPDFVAFVERDGGSCITAERALRWATLPAQATPKWWATRLGMVRELAKYLAALDPRTEVPSAQLLPKWTPEKLTPYLYTDEEVVALMRAAQTLHGLKGATYATLLGLLATTGMRVGEALRLDRADIDWRERVLLIRHSKFGKSRELPLHPSTVEALRNYARQRDRSLPHPRSSSFLLSLAGTRLNYKNVHFCFLRLLRRAGLADCEPRRPRLHDLRHTFALKTIADSYRAGLNVRVQLSSLSTYLGHVSPSNTYWYLS